MGTNKRNFSISYQLTCLLGIFILLIAIELGITLVSYNQSSNDFHFLNTHTVSRTLAVKQSQLDFTLALQHMRGYVAYGNGKENYLQLYKDSVQKSIDAINDYNSTSLDSTAKVEGDKLQKMLVDYQNFATKIIGLRGGDPAAWQAATQEGQQKVADINAQFEKLTEIQEHILQSKSTDLLAKTQSRSWWLSGTGALVVILNIICTVWYSRRLLRRLNTLQEELTAVGNLDLSRPDIVITRQDEIGAMAQATMTMKQSLTKILHNLQSQSNVLAASGEEMHASVQEQLNAVETVTNGVQSIAAKSQENSDHISQMSSTLEELSAASEEMSASAGSVNENTASAVQNANNGMNLLQNVVDKNENMNQTMQKISSQTTSLAESSQQIKGIIAVIQGIAGQTNLLALNAAIEAARAGEAGKGFAVVAEEVRKLAEQSDLATKDIEMIISQMGTKIDSVVTMVEAAASVVQESKDATEKSNSGFMKIIDQLNAVKSGIEQITVAVNDNARGTAEMVSSVKKVNRGAEESSGEMQTMAAATEEQTASMHEIGSNAESLAKIATELNTLIQKFKM